MRKQNARGGKDRPRPEQAPAVEPYLTPQAIAAQYGFDADSVRRWIVHGVAVKGSVVKLGGVRVGKSWRVPPAALEAFLSACNNGRPVEEAVGAEGRRKARKRQDDADRAYLRSQGLDV